MIGASQAVGQFVFFNLDNRSRSLFRVTPVPAVPRERRGSGQARVPALRQSPSHSVNASQYAAAAHAMILHHTPTGMLLTLRPETSR